MQKIGNTEGEPRGGGDPSANDGVVGEVLVDMGDKEAPSVPVAEVLVGNGGNVKALPTPGAAIASGLDLELCEGNMGGVRVDVENNVLAYNVDVGGTFGPHLFIGASSCVGNTNSRSTFLEVYKKSIANNDTNLLEAAWGLYERNSKLKGRHLGPQTSSINQ
ncbi:hypothetical protein LIER_27906 [Lithospermum erythrorhizon]|uniref:Uncharacterized protein n=1 Tax=Lithospermum erythrorhizon TaxID=34254 RepID=A0AAV3RDR8_LITER